MVTTSSSKLALVSLVGKISMLNFQCDSTESLKIFLQYLFENFYIPIQNKNNVNLFINELVVCFYHCSQKFTKEKMSYDVLSKVLAGGQQHHPRDWSFEKPDSVGAPHARSHQSRGSHSVSEENSSCASSPAIGVCASALDLFLFYR